MGKGKNWTQWEIDYLQENYGRYTLEHLCTQIDRTPSAIQNKVCRLKIGRWYKNGEYLTLNEISVATGIYHGTLRRWAEIHDFPITKRRHRKDYFSLVRLDRFWIWAADHRNMVEWDKIERLALGPEPEWVQEARKAKFLEKNRSSKKVPWTSDEDEKLRWLLKKHRYTYSEIAKEIGRTHGAIKRRIGELGIKDRPIYRENTIKYSEEEINYILKKYQAGYSFRTIADDLDRSEAGVRGKVERLGYRFENRVLVKAD